MIVLPEGRTDWYTHVVFRGQKCAEEVDSGFSTRILHIDSKVLAEADDSVLIRDGKIVAVQRRDDIEDQAP